MAETYKFRSAIGGFNREDVVRYIEYINSKHTSLVNQLKSENQALRDELSALQAVGAEIPSENVQNGNPEQIPVENIASAELEAYRRAEQMERNAKARANEIYRKATATLAEASVQLENAMGQVDQIVSLVNVQINELHSAAESSRAALQDASAILYAIRPEKTEA